MSGIHRSPVNSPHKGLLWCYFLSAPEQTWKLRWFETPSRWLWRHCNVYNDPILVQVMPNRRQAFTWTYGVLVNRVIIRSGIYDGLIVACSAPSPSPLSKPMLSYRQLHHNIFGIDHREHISMTFYLKFDSFHSMKFIWNVFCKMWPFCLGLNVLCPIWQESNMNSIAQQPWNAMKYIVQRAALITKV